MTITNDESALAVLDMQIRHDEAHGLWEPAAAMQTARDYLQRRLGEASLSRGADWNDFEWAVAEAIVTYARGCYPKIPDFITPPAPDAEDRA